jgi:hypothetical protein
MAPEYEPMHKPDPANRVRHYSIERWVDFARDLASADESKRMKKHARVCAACHDLMTFCGKLAAATQADAAQHQRHGERVSRAR